MLRTSIQHNRLVTSCKSLYAALEIVVLTQPHCNAFPDTQSVMKLNTSSWHFPRRVIGCIKFKAVEMSEVEMTDA